MPVKRVSPDEARRMIDDEGYVYVDVRSVPEFDAGHPEGSYNVPLAHAGPRGMVPNASFVEVMKRHFPLDSRIVVGCRSGGRSLQAAALLQSAGYTDVVDQRAGFEGGPDALGRMEPGWRYCGLPVSRQPRFGRSYAELEAGEA
jgi:rhodanese-related sulfurtransferase